ncbi:Cobalamin synthase [Aquimixticola soesokkakensis]|uniref:Adenosylcobinamide-GDP ribazoletransferase n=2 Tax=Aquimixticola soesokkakensis TaxID=1519096 RepID=A0A1Y5S9Y6_9RHOB|nr:Cobalamin synthase [Aquimixticola soesokkakensis]
MRDEWTNCRPADVSTALGLLTRLPLAGLLGHPDLDRSARAAWAYPLVGVVVGTLAWAIAGLAHWSGAGAGLAAVLVLTVGVMATGGMHEDGLADTADGFWGGWDVSRRLEIMKDSRVGTYGVLALVLAFLARFSALEGMIAAGALFAPLVAAAALSRASMPYLMSLMPHARDTGLSRDVGAVSRPTATLGAAIAAAISLVLMGLAATALAVLAVMVVSVAMGWLADRKIEGQTGDVLGATQLLTEIAALAVFGAFF